MFSSLTERMNVLREPDVSAGVQPQIGSNPNLNSSPLLPFVIKEIPDKLLSIVRVLVIQQISLETLSYSIQTLQYISIA